MSLVNDSLKFQMAILQIHRHFLLKLQRILTFFFSTKNNSVFAFEVDIELTNLVLNDSVKLTKFSTTGPWNSQEEHPFQTQ